MTVSATHPEYNRHVARWELVRDVVNSDVKQYIIDIDPNDIDRCNRYKHDACFTNFTGRTKAGLVGAVFRKDVEISLPESVAYLEDDATGSQIGLTKLAQEVTGEVLQAGRYGLLVDYPASQEGLTAADIEDMNIKAHISKYKPENIINWQTTVIHGMHKIILVVLKECISYIGNDGFTWMDGIQYRVLRLIDGEYVQELYDENEDIISQYIPKDANGQSWDFIPFVFVGSQDNDESIDIAPLYDLAQLNLGHLRNSADYEESIHVTGQPTLIISTSMSTEEFKSANPNGVKIGSRRGLNLGPSGSANLLQPSPNQLADVAMQRKEQQAVMIGARLVMQASSNETAEAARIKHSGENSVLATIVHNINDAINRCITWCMMFMSTTDQTDDIIFEISDKFFDTTLDPQTLMAQLQLYNSGIIATADVRHTLRETGLIRADRTDEDIQNEVVNINPFV